MIQLACEAGGEVRSSDLLGPRASRPHRVALRSRSQVSFNSDSLAFNEGGRDARGPSKSLDRTLSASFAGRLDDFRKSRREREQTKTKTTTCFLGIFLRSSACSRH